MIQNFKKMPQYFSHLTLESHLKIIQAWLFAVEQTLDGRGKMGSLVGASDEFKNGGGENAILEYCQWTMVLSITCVLVLIMLSKNAFENKARKLWYSTNHE